jgi:DNA-binding transcriptional LysR family regulator
MELRHLRYFVAVAEELHFGRAAERLRIAQSALSTQIQALERHLGVRLLQRSKRSMVAVTDAGTLVLEEARQTLRQAERTELVGRRAGRGELGRVEIGYVVSTALAGVLSSTVSNFRTGTIRRSTSASRSWRRPGSSMSWPLGAWMWDSFARDRVIPQG